jgi:hypothetical protein
MMLHLELNLSISEHASLVLPPPRAIAPTITIPGTSIIFAANHLLDLLRNHQADCLDLTYAPQGFGHPNNSLRNNIPSETIQLNLFTIHLQFDLGRRILIRLTYHLLGSSIGFNKAF